jgi:SAM-dependent methyltransferase
MDVIKMPTSDLTNITPIMSVISNLKPVTILDIGCGFGKYGVLMREYLELWQEKLHPESWRSNIVAIDAFAGYHNPIWDLVYNSVKIGDAKNILPTLGNFDVILIADVIEHFEKPDAINLVSNCLEKGKVVIVSTPREFYTQGDSFGNNYEIHRCLFQIQDFPSDCFVTKIKTLSCDIFIASRKPIDEKSIYPAKFEDLIYLRQRSQWKHLGLLGAVFAKVLKFANSL